eukprot:GILJ01001313.1.p1 GENE.GILJ01001313.1~~GILJ01001313.1.p1  ORF type:complete len:272 (+),score=25.92 GILJ01001313.1:49-864(+)
MNILRNILGGGGGPMGMHGFDMPQGPFTATYRVYPVSFIDKGDLEKGNKIILPSSALEQLARLHITYPMLFQIANPIVDRKTHCGVMEFIADEGTCFMPYWMMQNLLLQEGGMVTVQSVTLPKGQYVKIQPHTTDFLDIANPKAVLEHSMRNFAALTKGDSIVINFNNKNYEIDVLDTRPGNAISIIETDVEVDFAPPKDYVEPVRAPVAAPAAPSITSSAEKESADDDFDPMSRRIKGGIRPASSAAVPKAKANGSFTAFSGAGHTLRKK